VALAGSDVEHVYAISPDGKQTLWKHRCEVPADRMRVAPWWTISGKAQLQAILPDDLDRDGINEILCGTGGGCVEALTESGTRKWLTPIEWGIPDRFAIVLMPDGSKTLLVNNSYSSCGSTTWRLAPNGRLLSADAMPTGRGSWDMTAAPGLNVTDLNGDNKPEAIIGRKGAYNEIALYDAVTGRRKWVHTMGDEITAIEDFDTDLDGIKEVIVGSASSWLNAFNSEGRPIWSTPMPHEVKTIAAAGNILLVACNDANIYQVNRQGHTEARFPLRGSPLGCTVRANDLLIIGDSTGLVTALPANR
jgi:outer membrane protein assembly factor BamB